MACSKKSFISRPKILVSIRAALAKFLLFVFSLHSENIEMRKGGRRRRHSAEIMCVNNEIIKKPRTSIIMRKVSFESFSFFRNEKVTGYNCSCCWVSSAQQVFFWIWNGIILGCSAEFTVFKGVWNVESKYVKKTNKKRNEIHISVFTILFERINSLNWLHNESNSLRTIIHFKFQNFLLVQLPITLSINSGPTLFIIAHSFHFLI